MSVVKAVVRQVLCIITKSTSGSRPDRTQQQAVPDKDKEVVPLVSCKALPQLQCAVMTCSIGSWPHDSASATLSYKLVLDLTTLGMVIFHNVRHQKNSIYLFLVDDR